MGPRHDWGTEHSVALLPALSWKRPCRQQIDMHSRKKMWRNLGRNLEVKEKGLDRPFLHSLQRNQSCWHLDLGLLASRLVGNLSLLSKLLSLWSFVNENSSKLTCSGNICLITYFIPLHESKSSLMSQGVKNPPAMQETHFWSLC